MARPRRKGGSEQSLGEFQPGEHVVRVAAAQESLDAVSAREEDPAHLARRLTELSDLGEQRQGDGREPTATGLLPRRLGIQ